MIIILTLILLGLCLGSFVNALVWRIHEQSNGRKAKKLKAQDLSILKGRSMCVHCHHTLTWYDLVPILSWLSLRGRCRYCHKPISWQYPIVEILTAGLFVLSYLYFPYQLTASHYPLFLLWLFFLVGFIALIIYDSWWMLLPDRIIIPLQLLAALYVITELIILHNRVAILRGAGLSIILTAGLFYGLFQVSQGTWFGGGDVKLAVVLGLLLGGAFEAVLMLFIASVLGTLFSLPQLLTKKQTLNGRIPFGPFLIIATIIVYLFGASVITWYKRQFMIV